MTADGYYVFAGDKGQPPYFIPFKAGPLTEDEAFALAKKKRQEGYRWAEVRAEGEVVYRFEAGEEAPAVEAGKPRLRPSELAERQTIKAVQTRRAL